MEPSERAGFDSTRWTLIERVRSESESERQAALDEFLRRYLPALRAHLVVRRRMQAQDAEDLLQDFVANKILERDLVSRADRDRGRFRSFLLTALDRYYVDRLRYNKAQKRGAAETVALGPDEFDPSDRPSPDVFDIAWGRMVLKETLGLMHQVCAQDSGSRIWETFRFRILDPIISGVPPMEYEALVELCGFDSPRQASNALITARRRFDRCLRDVVAEYADGSEINEEIEELHTILSDESAWTSELMSPELGLADDEEACHSIGGSGGPELAELMVSDSSAAHHWQPNEIGQLLKHVLETPLAEVAAWSETLIDYAMWSHRPAIQLFEAADPPIALLEETKRVGRAWAKEESAPVPVDIGTAIYFVSIAVALVRHQTRITSSTDDRLGTGFQRLLDSPWLDERLVDLLRAGLEAVSP